MDTFASRVETLLQSVLMVPSDQRTAFIHEACAGDTTLERELQQLVLGYERAAALEEPIADLGSPVRSSLTIGTILDDKYEIIARLGAGGMGEVFKARHVHLDTMRCVKVMRKDLTAHESLRRRFVREGMAATRLHHPNVATVHDVSKMDDGSYYLVTEFIDGLTLRQWIAAHGRLSVSFAVDVALQVLAGLQHCHDRGLLHRDISSENIMISKDPTGAAIVKIIDLGIAKLMSGPPSDATREGLFIGNPRYSSPEQLGLLPEGGRIDSRADLYCLGVVLYEMVAGTPPFMSTTPQGYAAKHLTQPVPTFASVNPLLQVPAGFEDVVRKSLEKDRRRRYASARAFADALKEYASEVPLTTWVTTPANEPASIESRRARSDAPTEPLPDLPENVPTLSDPASAVMPPTRRRARLGVAAASVAAVIVLMVAVRAFLLWSVDLERPRSAPARVPAHGTTRSVAGPTSFLAIDALPWGEISAIVDASGRNVLSPDAVRYTPVTIPLPPGRYRVSISSPKRAEPLLLDAEVPKSGIATLQANFGPTEAADYFARATR